MRPLQMMVLNILNPWTDFRVCMPYCLKKRMDYTYVSSFREYGFLFPFGSWDREGYEVVRRWFL